MYGLCDIVHCTLYYKGGPLFIMYLSLLWSCMVSVILYTVHCTIQGDPYLLCTCHYYDCVWSLWYCTLYTVLCRGTPVYYVLVAIMVVYGLCNIVHFTLYYTGGLLFIMYLSLLWSCMVSVILYTVHRTIQEDPYLLCTCHYYGRVRSLWYCTLCTVLDRGTPIYYVLVTIMVVYCLCDIVHCTLYYTGGPLFIMYLSLLWSCTVSVILYTVHCTIQGDPCLLCTCHYYGRVRSLWYCSEEGWRLGRAMTLPLAAAGRCSQPQLLCK